MLIPKHRNRDAFEEGCKYERHRIARELHDRVLQVLASAALQLEATRKFLFNTGSDMVKEIRASEEEVRTSIKEIRNVLAADGEGWQPGTLLARIEAAIRQTAEETGIRITCQREPREFSLCNARVERAVFFATREALLNISRHSNATEARVGIVEHGKTLTVTLTDNGRGFDWNPDSKAPSPIDNTQVHYGLTGMASRIQELGGHVKIRSEPGRGTTVVLSVPTLRRNARRPFLPTGTGRHGVAFAAGGAAAAAVAATVIFLLIQPSARKGRIVGDDLLDRSVTHYQRVTEGSGTGSPTFRSPFESLDLSPWGYKVLSTKVREHGGLESRAFVYQQEHTKTFLIAEEFDGVTLPSFRGERMEALGQTYVTASRSGVNTVAWKENDMLCVLTSSMPRIELLELAQRITSGYIGRISRALPGA